MKEYNVVVIGAGQGGISAAVALAQNGLKPLVLEQHNLPGGCASSFVRGRFEFDVSLHSMYYETSFRPIFEGMMHLDQEFPKIADNFEYVYVDEDGVTHREYYRLDEDMVEQINKNHPGCGELFPKFVTLMMETQAAFFSLTQQNMAPEELMEKFPNFAKYGNMTLGQVLDEYNAPLYMRGLLGNFWWYLGLNSSDCPFPLYSLVAGNEYATTVSFPKLTAHGYLAEMEKKVRDAGGDIWYNTSATKILTKDGAIYGVETSQGDVIKTSNVLCNIDPRVAIGRLLDGADEFKESILEQQRSVIENFSFFTIYLGMDATAEELGICCHHTYINEDMNLDALYDNMDKLEGPRVIGVLAHNNTIPDFSPEGTCILSLSVPVHGSILEGLSQKEYFEVKREFEKTIIEKVEKHLNVDLKSHIEEVETASPATLARYARLYNGALGNSVSNEQMAKVMGITQQLNSKIKGLVFSGQFSGSIGYKNSIEGYFAGLELANKMKEEK